MLFTLIKNEWIKIFKRSKTWIVFILFILIMALSVYSNFRSEYYTDQNANRRYESIVDELKYIDGEIALLEEDLDNISKEKKEYYEDCKTQRENLLNDKKIEELRLEAKNNPNAFKETLDIKIKDIKNKIDNETDPIYKSELQLDLDELQYLKDNNIDDSESWRVNPYNTIDDIIRIFGSGLLLIGIAVFMSDIVSGECTPPTLKFLLIQSVSRGKILLSKFIAITTTAIGLIVIPEILVFLGIGIVRGFDAGKFPEIIGTRYQLVKDTLNPGEFVKAIIPGSSYISTNSMYTLQMFLLQILFIIACCAFIFMISTLFKSSMVTMALSVITLFTFSIVGMFMPVMRKNAHMFFINYGYPGSILKGTIVYQYDNINMTVGTVIIVTIVTSIVSYLISHIIFTKRDILI